MEKSEIKVKKCWNKIRRYSLFLIVVALLASGTGSLKGVYAQDQSIETAEAIGQAPEVLLYNIAFYGQIIKDLLLSKEGKMQLLQYNRHGYLGADGRIAYSITKTVNLDDVETLREIGNKNITYWEGRYKDQMQVYIKDSDELRRDLKEADIHERYLETDIGIFGWGRISIPNHLAHWRAFTKNADNIGDRDTYIKNYTGDYANKLNNIQQFDRDFLERLTHKEYVIPSYAAQGIENWKRVHIEDVTNQSLFKPGDVLLFKGKGLIPLFTGGGNITHVAIYYKDGLIAGMAKNGGRISSLQSIKDRDILVFRNEAYPERTKAAANEAARLIKQGIKYDKVGFAGYALPGLPQGRVQSEAICSEFVNNLLQKHNIGIVDTEKLKVLGGGPALAAPNYMGYALGATRPIMRLGPEWSARNNINIDLGQGGILFDIGNTYLVDQEGFVREIEKSILETRPEKESITWKFQHEGKTYKAVALPFEKKEKSEPQPIRYYYNNQQNVMVSFNGANVIAIRYLRSGHYFHVLQVAEGKRIKERSDGNLIFRVNRIILTNYNFNEP